MSDEELDMMLVGFVFENNPDKVLDTMLDFKKQISAEGYKKLSQKIKESVEFYKNHKSK